MTHVLRPALATACLAAGLWGCESEPASTPSTDTAVADAGNDLLAETTPVEPEEYVATLDDFDCVKNGVKVGRFYVANHVSPALQEQAVAVAQQQTPGGKFPVGTMLRLFPLEAFIKRGKGFEATDGWEVFLLKRDASNQLYIDQRGGIEVSNAAGSCFGCHSAAKAYDSICGTTHGCDPLGVSDEFISALQDVDPACAAK